MTDRGVAAVVLAARGLIGLRGHGSGQPGARCRADHSRFGSVPSTQLRRVVSFPGLIGLRSPHGRHAGDHELADVALHAPTEQGVCGKRIDCGLYCRDCVRSGLRIVVAEELKGAFEVRQ